MPLKLYNSLGRKLETFEPLKAGEVRMYTCGPTVWNYAHMGNYRTFVFEDVLRRYLKFKGFKVIQVMNITDVEDKIIKGIKQSKKSLGELTTFYEGVFMEDLATLGVERAEQYPKATQHIPEMVSLIQTIMAKGFAYRATDGSIYYNISKFKDYGALSGVKVDSQRPSGRLSSDHYEEKEEAFDFALWKAWDPDDGEVFWETGLGKGRPGWSVECSAMSMKYLGETFDIHTGGLDNKFPHHENEIAQSEAATGKKFVRYWLHSGFMKMEGAEMHKSVGNVVYLRDLLSDGWDPGEIRLFLVSSRYRDSVDLTRAGLAQTRAVRLRIHDYVRRLARTETGGSSGQDLAGQLLQDFELAMDDDLNTPAALAAILSHIKKVNTLLDRGTVDPAEAKEILSALKRINSVLGVISLGEEELPERLMALVKARDEARKRKDFAESDRIRALLLAEGVIIEDSPQGTVWKRRQPG